MKPTVLHMQRVCWSGVLSVPARSVSSMTTETLMEYKRGRSVVTAQHDSRIHGMKYALHCTGYGQHVEIACATETSVVRLFNDVVAWLNVGLAHPFTARM